MIVQAGRIWVLKGFVLYPLLLQPSQTVLNVAAEQTYTIIAGKCVV
jgi:hypothetical protein